MSKVPNSILIASEATQTPTAYMVDYGKHLREGSCAVAIKFSAIQVPIKRDSKIHFIDI